MATTFNVIPLGVQASIDPSEGDTQAENAAALVGLSFGDVANPLWETVQELTPGSSSYTGGNDAAAYDQDNFVANETFSLDGGPDQVFDGTAVYNATITYVDGSTATITAVIFQDTAGNTYLAPEYSANADQAALEAQPIRALSLDSLFSDDHTGMYSDRETINYAVCFVSGTRILTPFGPRPVETLRIGDLVQTLDHGAQPVRWIGGRRVAAERHLAPISIEPGALGAGLPARRISVSRQHRLVVRSRVAERMFGAPEALVAARHLLNLPGVAVDESRPRVDYWHLMCDRHEVVFAEGAPAETLYLGAQALGGLSAQAREEILAIFPDLATMPLKGARPIPAGRRQRRLVERLQKNRKAAICLPG